MQKEQSVFEFLDPLMVNEFKSIRFAVAVGVLSVFQITDFVSTAPPWCFIHILVSSFAWKAWEVTKEGEFDQKKVYWDAMDNLKK